MVVEPLAEDLLPETAELLAEVFAESKGYGLYKSFLKRQILAYLRTRMGPQGLTAQGKSVVLTVCVQEPEAGDSDAQQSAQAGQPGTSSALHGGPPSAAEAASSESTGESSASESYRAAAQGYSSLHVIDSTVESSANTSTSSDEDEGSGSQHVRRRRRRQLLATAEVSFDPSTRSSQPLLVEPPNCAYLSNMAVRGSARRAGLGSLLVSCAEQIARTLGRRDMYLHLRFKDAPAQALYAKAGFSAAASHPPVVFLLGWDRMYLMRKPIS